MSLFYFTFKVLTTLWRIKLWFICQTHVHHVFTCLHVIFLRILQICENISVWFVYIIITACFCEIFAEACFSSKQQQYLWYLLTFQEALFEVASRQNLEEEKQNQLRWQVKCGDKPMTTKSKAEVLATRKDTFKEYLVCALQ